MASRLRTANSQHDDHRRKQGSGNKLGGSLTFRLDEDCKKGRPFFDRPVDWRGCFSAGGGPLGGGSLSLLAAAMPKGEGAQSQSQEERIL
ncbi:MAG: hypothetical protein M2R46_05442 [Verrucomicrobia subdivision 3 bacterium]|nr:hypothetical protein [Limisphaerales bacterium]